jgi:hypothetical protein
MLPYSIRRSRSVLCRRPAWCRRAVLGKGAGDADIYYIGRYRTFMITRNRESHQHTGFSLVELLVNGLTLP